MNIKKLSEALNSAITESIKFKEQQDQDNIITYIVTHSQLEDFDDNEIDKLTEADVIIDGQFGIKEIPAYKVQDLEDDDEEELLAIVTKGLGEKVVKALLDDKIDTVFLK